MRPGDTIYVNVEYSGSLQNNSGGVAYYVFDNETTDAYASFNSPAKDPGWRAANFVNEWALNKQFSLPDFGSVVFSGCGANDNDYNSYALNTGDNNRVLMTDSGTPEGNLMSTTGAVNNATAGFTVQWVGPD